MRRNTLLGFSLMLMACSHTTGDNTEFAFYSLYSLSANFERTDLYVMEPPNVLCRVVDLGTNASSQWKEYVVTAERYARLVELVDDMALVDRYRIDARPVKSVRECIEGTSICYDPGISLVIGGPLSPLADRVVQLLIPLETDEAWTEETTRMAEEYTAVLNECISQGTPVEPPGY